jgi:tetratricopeptide (TPR) repeat protein
MLHNESYTAAEVAYKTGFGSPAYFNKCFHEYFGYPPGKVVKGSDFQTSALPESSQKRSWLRTHILSFSGILLLILLSGITSYYLYIKINRAGSSDDPISPQHRISIVVLPFQNMTRDTVWNLWQNGIQECLISSFSNCVDLKVRQIETVNTMLKSNGISEYAAISPRVARKISQKLDADIFIYGSIKKAGSSLRLDAQLIDAKSKEVLKSFETKGPYEEAIINDVIDSLRKKVTDFLIISKLMMENPLLQMSFTSPSKFPEAFRYFIYGKKAAETRDWQTARKWYFKALEIDSTFWAAALNILVDYGYEGNTEQNLKWVIKLYEKRDQMPRFEQLWVNWAYACNFEPYEKVIKYLKQLKDIDESPSEPYLLGLVYMTMNQYDKAIPEYERSVELCRKWGIKPHEVFSYYGLIYGYYKTSQQKKLKKIIKEVVRDTPDEPNIIFWQSILSLTEKDTIKAAQYIEKIVTIRKSNSVSDADIAGELASNYSDLGIQDKAEEYFRKALTLAPENPNTMFAFARFLNDNNRKLNEVPELMDKALKLAPGKIEYYNYLDTKGWSFYKLGRYQEALKILEKTFSEAPFPYYSIKSHLDEVKNAVGQRM